VYKERMSEDSKIPDSWAMPDDLAKRVSQSLSKKRSTPEDELANALEELARDIALIEPDPEAWAGWVIYLLEQLETEAKRRGKWVGIDVMSGPLLKHFHK
jgi:hypothetical protein